MNGFGSGCSKVPSSEELRRGAASAWWPRCLVCAVLLTGATLGHSWAAGPGAPGESSAGIFHAITHLPLGAYLILFFIFALSVANLIYQGRVAQSFRPFSMIRGLLGGEDRSSGGWSFTGLKGPEKRSARPGHVHGPTSISNVRELASDGVLAVRQVSGPRDIASSSIPTPLEGLNHCLPQFSTQGRPQPGSPRVVGPSVAQEAAIPEFKFSSAVDLPSQEELERREKEQLVVTGAVLGPDEEGIESVVVYLEDEEGNRIGQSCRSALGTGEFKVLANELGRYVLKAYKRGLTMEQSEPAALPIEAGKIEGYTIRMIPEGCMLHGKVFNGTQLPLGTLFEVQLHVSSQGLFRSVLTDSVGGFRIGGIPRNSECRIQVLDENGSTLAVSEWFDVGEKKEILMDVTITEASLAESGDFSSESGPEPLEAAEAQPSSRPAGSSHHPS